VNNYFVIAMGLFGAVAQPASAQTEQPSPAILAQALDRCMATYAVRLTKTGAADDAIFTSAVEGCKQIETDLKIVVRRDIAPAQAEAAIMQWGTQAKPNFMSLLQRIRADRAALGGQ
jgi:hypothetical protein